MNNDDELAFDDLADALGSDDEARDAIFAYHHDLTTLDADDRILAMIKRTPHNDDTCIHDAETFLGMQIDDIDLDD